MKQMLLAVIGLLVVIGLIARCKIVRDREIAAIYRAEKHMQNGGVYSLDAIDGMFNK